MLLFTVGLSALGGDLGGQRERSPKKKLRWGDGPCIRTPNISRSSVIGCVAKYEQTKKCVTKECFVLKYRFFGKLRVIYVLCVT